MEIIFTEEELAKLNIKARAYAKNEEVLGEFNSLIEKIKEGDTDAARSYRELINDKTKCYSVDIAAPKIVDYYTEYCENQAYDTWVPIIEKGGDNQMYAEDMLDLQQSLAPYESQVVANDEVISELEGLAADTAELSNYTANALEDPSILEGVTENKEMQELINERASAVLGEVKKSHPLSFAIYDAKNGLANTIEDLKIAQENAKETIKVAKDHIKNAADTFVIAPAVGMADYVRDVAVRVAEGTADIAKSAANKASEAVDVARDAVVNGAVATRRTCDVVLEKITFGAYSNCMKNAMNKNSDTIAKLETKINSGQGSKIDAALLKLAKANRALVDKTARIGGDYDTYYNQVRQFAYSDKEPLADKVASAAKEGVAKVSSIISEAKDRAKEVSAKFVSKVSECANRTVEAVAVAHAKVKSTVLTGLGITCEKIANFESNISRKYQQRIDRCVEKLENAEIKVSEAKENRAERIEALPAYEKKERVQDPKVEEAAKVIRNSTNLSSYDKNFALSKLYSDEAKADAAFEKKEARAESFNSMMNKVKTAVISAGCAAKVATYQTEALMAEQKIASASKKKSSAEKLTSYFEKGKGTMFGLASKAASKSMESIEKVEDSYEK